MGVGCRSSVGAPANTSSAPKSRRVSRLIESSRTHYRAECSLAGARELQARPTNPCSDRVHRNPVWPAAGHSRCLHPRVQAPRGRSFVDRATPCQAGSGVDAYSSLRLPQGRAYRRRRTSAAVFARKLQVTASARVRCLAVMAAPGVCHAMPSGPSRVTPTSTRPGRTRCEIHRRPVSTFLDRALMTMPHDLSENGPAHHESVEGPVAALATLTTCWVEESAICLASFACRHERRIHKLLQDGAEIYQSPHSHRSATLGSTAAARRAGR